MNQLPNFVNFGYQIQKTLGHNYFGGRLTYLANKVEDPNFSVVIKQFQFSTSNSDWLGYKAYQREISILEQLKHSGIPKYLDSFETNDGFCMVQEYKEAPSLAISRSYTPQEIKQMAIAILEILIYLQNRIPTIIHRDLKPENILLDATGKVYLVDFGFARLGGDELAMSSVTLGTLGFMPPEQLYNRQLTAATDLYSLGMTLICLLTQTKSTAVDSLIDENNKINFRHLLPQLSQRWLDWLQTLVQRNPNHRYANAIEALEALKPIYVFKQPEAKLSTSNLEFIANTYGEKITKTITITNSVVETNLEGNWQVAPHPSDPPHTPDKHAWISFSRSKFASNRVRLEITVDTSKLLAGKQYQREILLTTNSYPEIQFLPINITVVELLTSKLPYLKIIIVSSLWTIILYLVFLFFIQEGSVAIGLFLLGAFLGANLTFSTSNKKFWNVSSSFLGAMKGGLVLESLGSGIQFVDNFGDINNIDASGLSILAGGIVGAMIPIAALRMTNQIRLELKNKNFGSLFTNSLLITIMFLSCSASYGLINNFNLIALWAIGINSVGLLLIVSYSAGSRNQIIEKYRQSKCKLIKP